MKTITCREMGGMCDEQITAATEDEMLSHGMRHLEAAHPEMAATVKGMSQDDPMIIEWAAKFHETWETSPDNAE